jgi:glycosyltransferase involved in cell wall biosynthesis
MDQDSVTTTPRSTGPAAAPISSVSVIVPAYNEAASISRTLADAIAYFRSKPYDFEIIVTADGNDGTRELVAELALVEPRLRVIGHAVRRGKGRGIREGVALAHGDIIGFIDADNKSPISEFDKVEAHFARGADVVIGSRAMPGSRIDRYQPWYRRIGSKAFAVGMHAVVGLWDIPDTQCGFKFFRREAALDIFSRQRIDGYMFDVEILHLARRSGYRLAQVPVTWRDDGDSRLQLVRGNLRNFADIVRIGWSRLQTPPPNAPNQGSAQRPPDQRLRVLLVSINYAPEQTGFAQHVTALAESLVRCGHVVTVLTGFPFSPQWQRWPDYRGRLIAREEVKGVEIVRLSHFIPGRPGRLLQRVWMEMSFSLMAWPSLAWSHQAPWNVIVYYGAQPSLAMFSRALAWWKRVPYVVSIQDLAAQAASDVGIVRHPLVSRMMERFEYATYRDASGAVVLCDAFRDALVSHGYDGRRIHVIPSPIDIDHIRPVAPSGGFRQRHGVAAGDFVVLYAGSMGLKQGLVNVIEAARETAASASAIKWILVGDGDGKSALGQLIHQYGLDDSVKLLPLQPEEDMPDMFASADLLLLNQVSAVKTTVVPSKLLMYMAAGKPVLAAINPQSQGAALLRRATGGMLVEADNPQALAAGVLRLRDRDRPELLDMGRRNRAYAEQHFDHKRIVRMQEALLMDVAFPTGVQPRVIDTRPA